MNRTHDIAIYAPGSTDFYDEEGPSGGGAELQASQVAGALASHGFRVAHIVFPVAKLRRPEHPTLTVLQRQPHAGSHRLPTPLVEVPRVWRALADADASVYVFRGSSARFIVGVAFCTVKRRKLILSASNDLDFIFDRADRSRWNMLSYRLGLRRVDAVVAQTDEQAELAREGLGGGDVRVIKSFSPLPELRRAGGEAFLWAGRLVDAKLPLRYVDLAAEVPEARFLMIASPTNETPATLAEELHVAAVSVPNLELLEPLPREQMLALIGRSIAVVSTSRFEGLPNVFLEAWGRAVPALSLHLDPAGVIAREGAGVFARGSWDQFVAGARSLAADPALRVELGERGRAYVARAHDPEEIGGRWVNVISEFVKPAVLASH